jgi:prenyltransferase beta subunit
MIIRHTCHNKQCVNPNHLKEGNFKDNSEDSLKDDKLYCKLKVADVLNIMELFKNNVSINDIHKEYNIVSKQTISGIVKNKRWKCI